MENKQKQMYPQVVKRSNGPCPRSLMICPWRSISGGFYCLLPHLTAKWHTHMFHGIFTFNTGPSCG